MISELPQTSPAISPLYAFLLIVALVFACGYYLLRGTVNVLRQSAAEHAKTYAVAYIKGGALVTIAVLTAFNEEIQNLAEEAAVFLPGWIIVVPLFNKPIVAGLAVVVAFLDRSTERARDEKEEKAKTNPPFAAPAQ